MKIRPVGAELFHVDERTVMTKLTAAFRNFANAPKNETTHASRMILLEPNFLLVLTRDTIRQRAQALA